MESSQQPLAIIGLGCRFSGEADNPDRFWKLLSKGRDTWSPIPPSKFNVDGVYHPDPERSNTTPVRGGHFLKQDVAVFDAPFFNITSETASAMDPQCRLQLEVVYETLENAGISLEKVMGSNTSVFSGMFSRDYHDLLSRDPDTLPRYFLTGVAGTMMSNRVSHFFDLRGASVTVDTACSTTLTALHLGCQNLRTGESDMSIVTGANVIINPDYFIGLSTLGILSPEGISHAFDSRANGYGRGEGVATIIVKRLDDALRDGDPIRAVIRDTGLNQDGKTPTITTPNPAAQERLVRSCYQRAGLDPRETLYVEAHGTGTPVGDPLEFAGISAALEAGRRGAGQPLYVGSVKANIGHTEATSGLASIIKVVLAMENGLIPPSAAFEQPNKALDLAARNTKIATSAIPWPSINGVRRASVNNFGFGGANAHAIVEWSNSMATKSQLRLLDSIPPPLTNGNTDHTSPAKFASEKNGVVDHINSNGSTLEITPRVFVLSARDKTACEKMAANLADYLRERTTTGHNEEKIFLRDLAFTLGTRRSQFGWKGAHATDSIAGLVSALDEGLFESSRVDAKADGKRVGFVFTGQGAQWWAMGRELIATYPVFRETIEECDVCIKEMGSSWSLLEELHKSREATNVNRASYSLPMSTAIQVALVRLLRSWGIQPSAVVSHSSGEVAAAYAVGALSLREAIGIPYLRGVVTSRADEFRDGRKKGGMLAAGLGREEADRYVSNVASGKVVVACMNSPSSVTISGDMDGILELEETFKKDRVFARVLKVEEAFHSHHMEWMGDLFQSALMGLLRPGSTCPESRIAFSSPQTGDRLSHLSPLLRPRHWVDSMLKVVEFVDAYRNMCFSGLPPSSLQPTQEVDLVIEIGAHGALGGPIQQIMAQPEFEGSGISYHTTLSRGRSSVNTMHQLAVELIQKGIPVSLDAINNATGSHCNVVRGLPSYPWKHETRYWKEPRVNKAYRGRQQSPNELIGSLDISASPSTPRFRTIVNMSSMPWLSESVLDGRVVFPSAGFISMAVEGMAELSLPKKLPMASHNLRNVEFLKPLFVPDDDDIELQLEFRTMQDGSSSTEDEEPLNFDISSVTLDNQCTTHCTGTIMRLSSAAIPILKPNSLNSTSFFTKAIDGQDIRTAKRNGFSTNVERVLYKKNESLTIFSITDLMPGTVQIRTKEHKVHPTTMDAVIQSAYTCLPQGGSRMLSPSTLTPKRINSMWVSSGLRNIPGSRFNVQTKLTRQDDMTFFQTDLDIFDHEADPQTVQSPTGTPVIQIEGLDLEPEQGDAAVMRSLARHDNAVVAATTKWGPDLSLSSLESIKTLLKYSADPAEADTIKDLRRATFYFIHDAMTAQALTESATQHLEPHHAHFHAWMQEQLKLAAEGKLGADSAQWPRASPEERARLYDRVCRASVDGEMLCRLGSQLAAVLRQEVAPMDLMLQDGLLTRYHAEALGRKRSRTQVGELVRLSAHTNPASRILEVGAATGACARAVLGALGLDGTGGQARDNGQIIGRYDFTDVSEASLDAARKQFAPWEDFMAFRRLDITEDPASQGFETGTYDVVILSQMLGAVVSLERTLQHVRALLKPGGRMILVEPARTSPSLDLVFGVLPGWWQDDSISPCRLNKAVLTQNGFTGLDLTIQDCESEESHLFNTVMSTAATEQHSPGWADVVIFGSSSSPLPEGWIQNLRQDICTITCSTPSVAVLGEEIACEDKICVILAEIDQIPCDSLNHDIPPWLLATVEGCRGMLWVSQGSAIDGKRPEILESLARLNQHKSLFSLDLDPSRKLWTPQARSLIVRLLETCFSHSPTTGEDPVDFEHIERDGVVFVPRLLYDAPLSRAMAGEVEVSEAIRSESYLQPGQSGWKLDTSELIFNDDWEASNPLAPGFVEIEPKAYRIGNHSTSTRISVFEVSGSIVSVSPEAASAGHQVGDRVCALAKDPWRSHPRIHQEDLVKLPEYVSYEEGACIPVSFGTALAALVETARLQPSEKVLIHGHTQDVGLAAIFVAQLTKAQVFLVLPTEAHKNFILTHFDIPESHLFVCGRDSCFARNVRAMTGGQGVDVVLVPTASTNTELLRLQESVDCLCQYGGRVVQVGTPSRQHNVRIGPGVSVSCVDVCAETMHRERGLSSRLTQQVSQFLETSGARPVDLIVTYPISDVRKAFEDVAAGIRRGSVVVSVTPEDEVQVKMPTPRCDLRDDSSYLVVGSHGSDDLQRSLCEWLVSRGARNIILLSPTADAVETFLTEIVQSKAACTFEAVTCDMSESEQLAVMERLFSSTRPPICGVIQAPGVYQKTQSSPATTTQALVSTPTNVSWNLHTRLQSADTEFFIMLSMSEPLTKAEPNSPDLAAVATSQAALATHRRSKGLPATLIEVEATTSEDHKDPEADKFPHLWRLHAQARGPFNVVQKEELFRVVDAIIAEGAGAPTSSEFSLTGLARLPSRISIGTKLVPSRDRQEVAGQATREVRDARFSSFRLPPAKSSNETQGPDGSSKALPSHGTLGSLLASAPSEAEAGDKVLQGLVQKLRKMFSLGQDEVVPSQNLSALGVDSLVAVELRNWVAAQAGVEMTVFDLMQSGSLADLSSLIAASFFQAR